VSKFRLPLLLVCCAACRPVSPVVPEPAAPPQRIVAGSILATETLLAIAPRERIAAVHAIAADPRFSLVASEAAALPQVGASPEQLLAARPDLVIVDAFTRPETLALLDAAGVPVLRTRTPANFADIEANLRDIGRACHLSEPAEALIQSMAARLAVLRERAVSLGPWQVCSLDGSYHTYGAPSLFDAVVAAAGARNLAAARGAGPYRKLRLETLLSWRPDALVVAGDPQPTSLPSWLQQIPGLGLLPCLRQRRVLQVPGPLLATTSHHLVAAAEQIQAQLLVWGRP
jgi:iron complex transport system substrate-binding protein